MGGDCVCVVQMNPLMKGEKGIPKPPCTALATITKFSM